MARLHNPLPLFLVLLLLSVTTVAQDDDEPTSSTSQVSTAFTEAVTGLTMERFFGARTTFGFAMTMPETPVDSFIGQMTFPLVNGAGWGAIGLTGEMENNFFLAAWPDGAGGVMASFRQGTNEDDPPEVVGKFAVRPIAQATTVNNTFLSFTFVCEGCLDTALGLGAEATVTDGVMGWALSEQAVADRASPDAQLGFHERGFGPFTMRLGQARSTSFEAVAAQAGGAIPASRNASPVALNVAGGDGGQEEDEGDDDDDDKVGTGNTANGQSDDEADDD
ncbi:cellobiose dehydrogenase [Diaporthe amygdali]|uniref:cellobiose dehydrogenase n=1 Tax=Phomopsis amygdali TaxID=1214568 RepID=UPI0022FE053A|nr:cellobiose dehydrogenase [Diaporthe amygdali]KAJ0120428.1 cellobiose dehydrogenase [Diaporthe amygdali]